MKILLEKRAETAYLTLDRPPLNVLDLAAVRQLHEALQATGADGTVSLLVIRGAGERAFSAGVDVNDHTPDKVPEMLEAVHGAIRSLLSLPQITIAQVRGACLGGGCEIASSCDFILAAEDSYFATPEIQVGCYPPVALARFPSQIGYHRAADLILTGRRLSAQEAVAIGLINRAVPAGDLERAVEELLAELNGKSRAVLRLALKGLRELSLQGLSQRLARSEEIYLKELLKTEDVEEGARAFLEKRKPSWRHR
jgi:cyclohexa-1,5-dienecarbonyl-CoA hydratase